MTKQAKRIAQLEAQVRKLDGLVQSTVAVLEGEIMVYGILADGVEGDDTYGPKSICYVQQNYHRRIVDTYRKDLEAVFAPPPQCVRCEQPIQDAEYLNEENGPRHMCCPVV